MRWSLKFSILRVSSSFVRVDQGLWFRLFFLLGLIVFSFQSPWESSSLFRGHEGDDLDSCLHRFPLWESSFHEEGGQKMVGGFYVFLFLPSLFVFFLLSNLFCLFEPHVCFSLHIRTGMRIACPWCLGLFIGFLSRRPLLFLSELCAPGCPVIFLAVVAFTELFRVFSRMITLCLRMIMNLFLGHLLVLGAWELVSSFFWRSCLGAIFRGISPLSFYLFFFGGLSLANFFTFFTQLFWMFLFGLLGVFVLAVEVSVVVFQVSLFTYLVYHYSHWVPLSVPRPLMAFRTSRLVVL